MWANSKPKDYNTYRTFIFGISSQPMFPVGVNYEGENDNEPLYFRGESGKLLGLISPPLLNIVDIETCADDFYPFFRRRQR